VILGSTGLYEDLPEKERDIFQRTGV